MGAQSLVDLAEYEERFPLLQGDEDQHGGRRPSQSRLVGRRPSSRSRMSRGSTKENPELSLDKQLKKIKKEKGRPSSRTGTGDKERPSSRTKIRPVSRTGSVRSLQ